MRHDREGMLHLLLKLSKGELSFLVDEFPTASCVQGAEDLRG